MIMLTPNDQFTDRQVFKTPDIDNHYIADLVIIASTYPVEGLYINDQKLDVSNNP